MRGKLLIRPAVVVDASEIFKMLVTEHANAPIDLPAINAEKGMHHIVNVIVNGAAFMLGQEVDDKTVMIGTMGLEAGSVWYSSELWISDTWLYVKPKYRSFRAFRRLIDAAIALSEEKQISLNLGNLTGHEPERMDALYERCGFDRVGSQFVRRV